MQVHFCIIYLVSGSSKLLGAAWWNGTALWLCLANYNFAPMRVGLYDQALIFLCQLPAAVGDLSHFRRGVHAVHRDRLYRFWCGVGAGGRSW